MPYSHTSRMLGLSAAVRVRDPEPPSETRPPPEHEAKRFHWVTCGPDEEPEIVEWKPKYGLDYPWRLAGTDNPSDLHGYLYLGPVEWDASVAKWQGRWATATAVGEAARVRIAELKAEVGAKQTMIDALADSVRSLRAAIVRLNAGRDPPVPTDKAAFPLNAIRHSR